MNAHLNALRIVRVDLAGRGYDIAIGPGLGQAREAAREGGAVGQEILLVAHGRDQAVEERHLAADPWYVLLTGAAAGMSIWAWRLVRTVPR